MIRTIIIDDERLARNELKKMLSEFPEIEVVAEATNADEGIEKIESLDPQLILLDIQMPGKTGFDMLAEMDKIPNVIFTTAYDEYALKAFKLNSVDYLMKPIYDEELQAALEKFRRNRPSQAEVFDIGQLKALLNSGRQEYKKRFTIQVGQHLKLISTEDVSCFYSENKGTFVHCTTNRSYLLEGSLDKLEPELDPREFFRVNRQFIVRLENISDIVTYTNQRLEVRLKDYSGQQIIVSRERVKGFKEWLG